MMIHDLFEISIFTCMKVSIGTDLRMLKIVWKHLWTPSNQLIFFLAITDACVVLVLPSSIASIYFRENQMQYEWKLVCTSIMNPFLTVVPPGINCFLLTVIACERLFAVSSPLKCKVHVTTRKIQFIGASVVLSVITILPFYWLI